ncbi:MAG: hypothetical protein ACQEQ0_14855 [Bacteroidota bacterium]
MKRLLFITLILIIGASIGYSQNITNKQFTLIRYELEISDDFREDLEPLEDFIKDAKVRTENKEDKLKAIMAHQIYYHLVDRFEEELDIDIIPRNAFGDDARYNDFGYPKIRIGKALRKGSASFYFKINVRFKSKTEERLENDPELEEIDEDIFFPQIITKVTIYNDEGIIPVAKWRGEKITYEPIYLNKRLFRGFIDDFNLPSKPKLEEGEIEQPSLFELYNETLSEMITSFLKD